MSIRNLLGKSISSLKNLIFKKKIGNIAGSTVDINGLGLVCMDESKMEDLYEKVQKYIFKLQVLIDDYSYQGKLQNAYKGEVKEYVIKFLGSYKETLKSYIIILEKNIEEAKSIFEMYEKAQTSSINSENINIK